MREVPLWVKAYCRVRSLGPPRERRRIVSDVVGADIFGVCYGGASTLRGVCARVSKLYRGTSLIRTPPPPRIIIGP